MCYRGPRLGCHAATSGQASSGGAARLGWENRSHGPFVAIATSILPQIIGHLSAAQRSGHGPDLERSVAEIVQSVTGESDADAARSKISSDPNCAELLRSRLSELSATLDGTHSQEANASNSATIHELETRLSDQINALSANVDQARTDQHATAVQLQQQAADTATAKATLDRIGSPSSLPSITATVLSVAVVLGFFASLGFIVSDRFDPTTDTAKLQIVNIVIGALT